MGHVGGALVRAFTRPDLVLLLAFGPIASVMDRHKELAALATGADAAPGALAVSVLAKTSIVAVLALARWVGGITLGTFY